MTSIRDLSVVSDWVHPAGCGCTRPRKTCATLDPDQKFETDLSHGSRAFLGGKVVFMTSPKQDLSFPWGLWCQIVGWRVGGFLTIQWKIRGFPRARYKA